MTSGASTAGSTLPTEAKVCCKNIAARAINKPDIGVPLPRPIVVRGTELDGVVVPGLFGGGCPCCWPAPGEKSHAVCLGMFFVHCSRRDIAGIARTVGDAIASKDQRDRSLQHKEPRIKIMRVSVPM